jgi:hypothetical protein
MVRPSKPGLGESCASRLSEILFGIHLPRERYAVEGDVRGGSLLDE